MKQTVEEAAKEYAWRGDMYDLETAFKAGVDWQVKQSSWISVKERLPEKDGYYLVTNGEIMSLAYFLKCFNKFARYRGYPFTFYENNAIKAYVPIPSFDETFEANKDVLQRIKNKEL